MKETVAKAPEWTFPLRLSGTDESTGTERRLVASRGWRREWGVTGNEHGPPFGPPKNLEVDGDGGCTELPLDCSLFKRFILCCVNLTSVFF